MPSGLDTILFPTTVSAGSTYTQGGALTATVPHTYAFDAATNISGTYAITVTDRAGNGTTVPFSVYADHISPTVTITVPERPTTTQIPVQWSAQEDGSGLRGYDVEVKVDDGGWARVLTNTQNTTTTYPAEMGHTYAFRVRATDNVSNTSAWVEGVARTVVVKKYYHVAGQRIAMRSNNVLYWIHGDHLGSTSLTTNIRGTVVADQKYLPYGEVRWVTETLATDFAFTGQRSEDFGLMDYHARFYSPYLNRWTQPDSIIPDPANPQSFNRYAYVFGNPLKYVDRDGHFPWLIIPIVAMVALACTRSSADPAYAVEAHYVQSLNTTAASDLDALTTMFTTDQLSGDTVQERFATISSHTTSVPGFLYTGGGFGETGLNSDFQDGYMYEQHWGGETKQIGHFWTAVVYGNRASQFPSIEERLMQLAVGHEMVGDHKFVRQYQAASEEALGLFQQAIAADIWGDYDSRDEYLRQILMMNGGNLEDRRGNSLEDLRLTVRGWRFGQMIATGQFASREEAAQWLNDNLR